MGASSYFTSSHGKAAGQAFSRAAEADRHENGHSYSGGIGMKDGYLELPPLPARWTAEKVETLLGQVEYGTPAEQRKAREALHGYFAGQRMSLSQVLEVFNDKWAPSLCVEASARERKSYASFQPLRRGERVFVFFGLASS